MMTSGRTSVVDFYRRASSRAMPLARDRELLDSYGTDRFRTRLYAAWRKNAAQYMAYLEKHIGHHLELLYSEI